MRKLYWYATAYLQKHGKLLLTTVVLGILFFSLLAPKLFKLFPNKPTQYIGLVGSYTLDSLPTEIQELLSIGLTKLEPDGSAAPSLAERWIVEDEARSYRFVLKKNIKWQDGQIVKPEDIQYKFRDVETVSNPNDIVFKLPDAFVPFPTVTTKPILRKSQEKYHLFLERPTLIGIGPNWLADYKMHNQSLQQVTIENTKEIKIFRFFLTEGAAVTAFKRGEVDTLNDLSQTDDLDQWPTIEVNKKIKTNRYLAIFFDTAKPLFPKNIRQALAYATHKPDDDRRASSPINPDSWAYLEGGKTYNYDQERAFERLFDSIPQEPLSFELTTPGSFENQAESIKKDWEEFGRLAFERCQTKKEVTDKNICENVKIQVSIRINNFPDTNDFQVLLIGQESPPDPDQYHLWHSEQETNFTHYKNTRIDSLLEKGRTTTDFQDRLTIYQEFQQFFLEDSPAIFIEYLESYSVKRS